MWNRNKNKEDEAPARPIVGRSTTSDSIREGIPMSTMPTRNLEPELPRGTATIGKSVLIKGQIIGREDLVIDGEIEGTVELQEHRLTIGPNGRLKASVVARDIVVLGMIQGNVEATDKIEIKKDARLVGDIKTARIQIDDGAYFKGSIDITKVETVKTAPPAPAPKPEPAQATPIQQPLAASATAGGGKR
jgi:cytoskeletal protein CcmA (bactofilin family)